MTCSDSHDAEGETTQHERVEEDDAKDEAREEGRFGEVEKLTSHKPGLAKNLVFPVRQFSFLLFLLLVDVVGPKMVGAAQRLHPGGFQSKCKNNQKGKFQWKWQT